MVNIFKLWLYVICIFLNRFCVFKVEVVFVDIIGSVVLGIFSEKKKSYKWFDLEWRNKVMIRKSFVKDSLI